MATSAVVASRVEIEAKLLRRDQGNANALVASFWH
jgi:hypothetical protein